MCTNRKVVHLGIDLDNTIVTYNHVFHKYGVKNSLISNNVGKDKQRIRDTIRLLPNGNYRWTRLQALVYGRYMDEALPASGVKRFLKRCNHNAVKVSIISHKTVYPALGPRLNLRDAAKRWLKEKGLLSGTGLSLNDVSFVSSLDEKFSRIEELKCTHFVDDLLEVLDHPDFPNKVEKILYAPKGKYETSIEVKKFKSWSEIDKYLLE